MLRSRPTASPGSTADPTASSSDTAAFGDLIETRSQSRNASGASVWRVTRTVYDGHGRPVWSTDPYEESAAGLAPSGLLGTHSVYDTQGRATHSERRQGLRIDLVNGTARLMSSGGTIAVTQTLYDARGRVQASIDAAGGRTDYEYDSLDRRVATIGPAVSVDGVLLRHRSETVYDAQGRVEKQRTNIAVLPNGSQNRTALRESQFAYDALGNRVRTTFPDGSFVQLRFDDFGRQVAESQQVAANANLAWSAPLQTFVVGITTTEVPTKRFEYDSSGRLSAVILPSVPDPQDIDSATGLPRLKHPRYEYGYDAAGNLTLLRDPLGRETRFTYDDQGHQLSRTLPLGVGQVAGLADPRSVAGQTGKFTEGFWYDALGRPQRHVSFEGVVTEFVYDSSGRLQNKRFFDNPTAYANGLGTPSEVWSFQFDAFGREVEVTQTSAAGVRMVATAYDLAGRVVSVSSPEGVLGYSYDLLGRKSATKVFSVGANPATAMPQRVTRYAYDALGRLSRVVEDLDPASSLDAPLTTAYGYDLAGNLQRTDLPNGVVTEYVYDRLGRLDRQTDYGPDSTPADLSNNPKRAEYDYTVRADGKRTRAVETFWLDVDTDPATAPVPRVNQVDWSYDGAGRLVDEVFNHFDDTLDQHERFQYDLVGNRRAATTDRGLDAEVDEALATLFDANDRRVFESLDAGNDGTIDQVTTFGWNATQSAAKTVTASGVPVSQQTFFYDLQGRTAQVVTEAFSGGVATHRERVTFDYDAQGLRIASVHATDATADGTYESSTRTLHLFDHSNFTGYAQSIQETTFDSQNRVTQTIAYTFGLDEISQTTTDYTSGQPTVSRLIFGHDGHGSVRELFAMTGAVLQLLTYEAYGDLLALHTATGTLTTTALTTIQYSGEPFDARIAQQYLRARWMRDGYFDRLDDFSGNADDPQSYHKYAYVHGEPIQGIDPSGNSFALAGGLLTIGLGVFGAYSLRAKYDSKVIAVGGGLISGGLAYLGFIQMGNIARQWIGGYTTAVNVYVTPLSAAHSGDLDFTSYRTALLANRAAVEQRLSGVSNGNTIVKVIDGGLPPGTTKGYDSGTKTISIEVEWRDATGYIAQGSDWTLGVTPKGFKDQLQFWNDAGAITVPINPETKGTYLANMLMHETAHIVLERAPYRQWGGVRDHTAHGLMGGGPWGDNMSFNEGSQAIFDFDNGTKSELRAALGFEWAWW